MGAMEWMMRSPLIGFPLFEKMEEIAHPEGMRSDPSSCMPLIAFPPHMINGIGEG